MIFQEDVNSFLKEFEDKIELDSGTIDDSTMLYHYCNAEGLKGIIESKELWFSQRQFMNDAFEEAYAKDILQKSFEIVYADRIESEDAYLKFVERYIDLANEYIFSFSLERDAIHQWNYYSKGDGYCMVLRKGELIDEIRKRRLTFKAGLVIYDKDRQIKYCTTLLKKLKDVYDDGDPQMDQIVIYQIEYFIYYLMSMFKQKNHTCEKEYRVVINDGAFPTKFRLKNGLFLPYQIVDFKPQNEAVPIREILIGPSISGNIYKIGLDSYLESKELGHIPVSGSDIKLN